MKGIRPGGEALFYLVTTWLEELTTELAITTLTSMVQNTGKSFHLLESSLNFKPQ